MLSFSNRVSSTATLIAFATLLGGCVTGTEVSYSEYQYDRYGGAERTYEHNVYSDPAHGIESERCRTVVKRRINPFGEEVVRHDRVCDPEGEAVTAEPWGRPQSVYPSPVERPPADVPYIDGTEVDQDSGPVIE
jgi:hypothetical protein